MVKTNCQIFYFNIIIYVIFSVKTKGFLIVRLVNQHCKMKYYQKIIDNKTDFFGPLFNF